MKKVANIKCEAAPRCSLNHQNPEKNTVILTKDSPNLNISCRFLDIYTSHLSSQVPQVDSQVPIPYAVLLLRLLIKINWTWTWTTPQSQHVQILPLLNSSSPIPQQIIQLKIYIFIIKSYHIKGNQINPNRFKSYPPIYPSAYLSTNLSIYLPIYLST